MEETKVLEVEGHRLTFRQPTSQQRQRMGRDLLNASDAQRPAIYRSILTALVEQKEELQKVFELPMGRALAAGLINELTRWFGEVEVGPDYERENGVLIAGRSLLFRAPTDEETVSAVKKLQLGDFYHAAKELVMSCAGAPQEVEAAVNETGPLTLGAIAMYLLAEREPEQLNIRVIESD